jgi:hypothetical protein
MRGALPPLPHTFYGVVLSALEFIFSGINKKINSLLPMQAQRKHFL